MIQLIVFIIFIVSAGGLIFLLYKKVPVLVELPENGHHGIKKPKFVLKIEEKVKEKYLHIFEKKTPLHKLLSKTKVWVLKTETKIDNILHGIRKNAQELDKKNGKK